jgi:DNA-binding HxlR family transcriptional regulator
MAAQNATAVQCRECLSRGLDSRSSVLVEPDAPALVALQDVLASLGGKWVAALLFELRERPRRNFQLRQAVRGISSKALSASLQRLIRDGLVRHVVHEDDSGHVGLGYALTDLGAAAVDLLGAVNDWVCTYYSEIELSRSGDEGDLEFT